MYRLFSHIYTPKHSYIDIIILTPPILFADCARVLWKLLRPRRDFSKDEALSSTFGCIEGSFQPGAECEFEACHQTLNRVSSIHTIHGHFLSSASRTCRAYTHESFSRFTMIAPPVAYRESHRAAVRVVLPHITIHLYYVDSLKRSASNQK